ncbi:MAG: TetR family transcriptional regulator [Phormidesmis priestleyi]|uniref:TetR family transcriptional regulator n=1 Tax=Phormidesmis priestleyi TaxID=268141 RepID=A0A2W4XDA8_9CYAN|nr:MAG: TetR family transcriptional regulator [Phormidesmis priestleyi]
MTERKPSSRERIVAAARSLFLAQGITATTTKEIAEQAEVNEVTLFRQFGSKQGLLLAVLQEASILAQMQVALTGIMGANDPLMAYGSLGLDLLGEVPELVRSLIDEAGQSPPENRQALGQALRQANQQTVSYLRLSAVDLPANLSIESAAGLLNTLILGYAVLTFSSEDHGLWPHANEFLAAVKTLFLAAEQMTAGTAAEILNETADAILNETAERVNLAGSAHATANTTVADLPAEKVRSLFQTAKKQGLQAYALTYLLFGAGLRIEEAAMLLRSHSLSGKNQHLLALTGFAPRQVPLNRWIMGNRYGTYLKNPLTQWLKSRSDDSPYVFIAEPGEPLAEAGILTLWAAIATADTTNSVSDIKQITPFQAHQTWCIELLMKGMGLENLSLLSGSSLADLQPYARRAKEKAALEAALAIDQKS